MSSYNQPFNSLENWTSLENWKMSKVHIGVRWKKSENIGCRN